MHAWSYIVEKTFICAIYMYVLLCASFVFKLSSPCGGVKMYQSGSTVLMDVPEWGSKTKTSPLERRPIAIITKMCTKQ